MNLSRSPVWRSTVLLLASILFLFLLASNPIALIPLAGFLMLGYAALALIGRGVLKSGSWCIATVVLAYVWLKKYTFLPDKSFLSFPYLTLGLSYIFFRVLHLLIEAGGSDRKRYLRFDAYLLYCLNFTTLISGPIQRYDEFERDQFTREPIPLNTGVLVLQLERIVRGFFKINVLAVLLHAIQEDALAQMYQPLPPGAKAFSAFRLVVVYPFFLYANFSGYIDIVIALARLMRLRLPENFDRPFAASSVLEFWNRWHITLSKWLRTYVYNPLLLALMQRISSAALEPFLGVFCFFVTFFLIGVWHGRTSEFMFFGVLTGAGMSVNKLWQLGMARALGRTVYKGLAKNPAYEAFSRGLNFVWYAFTIFWFWGSWKQIDRIFAALTLSQWLGVWLAAWWIVTAVLAMWEWLRAALLSIETSEGPLLTSRYARVVYTSALGLIAYLFTALLNQPAPGIVYKTF